MDSIEAAARLAALKAAGRGDPSGGPSTQTITEFVLDRIAEDEAMVKKYSFGGGSWWPINPARVLAECEAKRRIVELHTLAPKTLGDNGPHDEGCAVCHFEDWWQRGDGPCDTIKTLASVYADHPDYRQEWRP